MIYSGTDGERLKLFHILLLMVILHPGYPPLNCAYCTSSVLPG